MIEKTLSVAPMMDWTDTLFRQFFRLISRKTILYTEMIHANAILKGDSYRFLHFEEEELPLVLQLGGDSPKELARAARMGQDFGYTEINLNIGCPSDRVQNGNFGACLMANPPLVAEMVSEVKNAVNLPVSVKHRIGIDGKESLEDLLTFIQTIQLARVDSISIHARIAILKGLSPKENREVPPLRYQDVYTAKKTFPELPIAINGGIRTWEAIADHLTKVDGVMIGREAYENPFFFSRADSEFWKSDQDPSQTRWEVLEKCIPLLTRAEKKGTKPHNFLRHILGLFHGIPGGKYFRRYISENSSKASSGIPLLTHLLQKMPKTE